MAESHPKRPREEEPFSDSITPVTADDGFKRQKPLHNILNFLENEEENNPADDDPSHDLDAIYTTLQQEISSSSSDSPTTADDGSDPFGTHAGTGSDCGGDEDETAKSVMRHLLEASDDELGIPNRREDENCFQVIASDEDLGFNFGDNAGLWELEDEAANYYTVLHAEFLM